MTKLYKKKLNFYKPLMNYILKMLILQNNFIIQKNLSSTLINSQISKNLNNYFMTILKAYSLCYFITMKVSQAGVGFIHIIFLHYVAIYTNIYNKSMSIFKMSFS